LIPVLNTFQITTVPHLNTEVTSLNNNFTTALDTGMQSQDKAYAASGKLSAVRMPTVLPVQK